MSNIFIIFFYEPFDEIVKMIKSTYLIFPDLKNNVKNIVMTKLTLFHFLL